jgi:hypothetical protein
LVSVNGVAGGIALASPTGINPVAFVHHRWPSSSAGEPLFVDVLELAGELARILQQLDGVSLSINPVLHAVHSHESC